MITWFTVSMTYILSWWLAFFLLLPIGNRPPENPESGHSQGAPEKTYLTQKFIGATVLAIFMTWGFFELMQSGWIEP